MATAEEYAEGTILEGIRKTLVYFNTVDEPVPEDEKSRHIRQRIDAFEPRLLTIEQAMEYIRQAEAVALGQRVCRALHPGSVCSESVFLDDLAIAMVRAGKARNSGVEDARKSLEKSSGHPLIISKVSGKHQEICPSVPSECVFWRAEKKGMHCLKRKA
ncbi:hypothetical protein [Chlorobium sp.]|jgi:hypothetical protein|uniref:hypothetical protein n=1 Tax=Chlorobium sp. TaxID=1095 RepID=UPI003C677CAD|nr:hypothetical protein [Chlorobiaceae bacterium]NTW94144.1 hypothetical protein [Chlorobiaceae bacterium]